MTLFEQAQERVELARRLKLRPARWIVTAAVATDIGADQLCDLPIEIGEPKSNYGLELVVARP